MVHIKKSFFKSVLNNCSSWKCCIYICTQKQAHWSAHTHTGIHTHKSVSKANSKDSSYLMTHWKRPWCWEGLGSGGEGDDRGCDGWMASPTQCTWVWVNSGNWWWTGRPGLLKFLGSKESDTTERLNWTELNWTTFVDCRPCFPLR